MESAPRKRYPAGMHVLVIGGNRFMGALLTWRLLYGGHRVTLLNRGLRSDPFGGRVERLIADRTSADFERVLAGRTFDAAVDFAAYSEDDARQVVKVLGEGRVGHYIFMSTGQVYLIREPRPEVATEEDYDGPLMERPHDPVDKHEWDYGKGKRNAEDALAAAWAESGFPATRIRMPMVNGERDYRRRIEGYLWRLLDGAPVIVPDGGDAPVRHVYGGEVVRAITGMLGNKDTFGKAYNISQQETPTLRELLLMLADLLGARGPGSARKVELVSIPSADLIAAGLVPGQVSAFSSKWMSFLDPTRARDELGFTHEPLAAYLGRIAASFQAHPPAEPPESYARRAREVALARR